MAQAFLHRQEHIGVAARFDMDHPIGMQTDEVQRRREQVAPPQAPEHRALEPREDASQEDRGAGVVSEIGAACDLVQGARDQSAARQPVVDLRNAERNRLATRPDPFDLGNAGAQLGNDGGVTHGIGQTRKTDDSFPVCSF